MYRMGAALDAKPYRTAPVTFVISRDSFRVAVGAEITEEELELIIDTVAGEITNFVEHFAGKPPYELPTGWVEL